MIQKFLQKYWIFIVIYIFYQIGLFVLHVNEESPLPYLNSITYFLIFLLIRETIPHTKLNYFLVKLFYYFYGYLSLGMSIIVFFRIYKFIFLPIYIISEILLKIFILVISIYLGLVSTKNQKEIPYHQIYLIVFLIVTIALINYSKFLQNPFILGTQEAWANFAVKNYTTMVLSILSLLVFWYRYYQKKIVLSEYLNVVIFIFMLSNIVETLHFVAFQLQFKIFIYGQIFNYILNLAMLYFWYVRWKYLESDLAKENERYLENFQYLNGLVSKPKVSTLKKVISFVSFNYILSLGFFGIIFSIGLFLIKKITFYLLLNTIFILITVLLALFFSFTSIKREWQNQIGVLFKKQAGNK